MTDFRADSTQTAALANAREEAGPHPQWNMSDNTYRVTEIVGSSTQGVDHAIRNAISRADQTLRNLDWFEVTQIRGHVEDGQIGHFQVGMKVGFRLEDE